MLRRWLSGEKHGADKHHGDPHALDVAGDPGAQSEEYRTVEPTDIVEENGAVMSGRATRGRKASRRTSAASRDRS